MLDRPEDFKISCILEQYHYSLKKLEEIKKENVAYDFSDDKEELQKLCGQLIYLAYTRDTFFWAEFFLIDMFIEIVENGVFNEFNGTGYYIDFNGEKLGMINWNNIKDYPEDTAFIVWYNK